MKVSDGVYTAIITPFLENGEIDFDGFGRLIEMQVHGGVQGIVVLGTTGEAPTLTHEEKKELIRFARAIVPKKVCLVVGTGTYATATTIEGTLQAETLGADAALVVVPYYNKPTQEGLYLHFEALAKAVALPLILYNIQGRTGQNLATQTLKRLAEFKSIVGVKDASGSISQMMEVIQEVLAARPDFKVFSGDDNLTLPLMALGGHGVISVVSNLVPEHVVELYRLSASGDFDAARQLHYELLPLFRGAFIETNPAPIKALLSYEGLPAGACRLPLSPLQIASEKALRHLHETIKIPLLSHG